MGTPITLRAALVTSSISSFALCGSIFLCPNKPVAASPKFPPAVVPTSSTPVNASLSAASILRPRPPEVGNVQMQCTSVAPLTVTIRDQVNDSLEARGAIRIVLNSNAGCIVQVGGAAGSGKKSRLTGADHSNLEIKVENRATGGQVLGAFSDYAPLPQGRRNLWASSRPVSSDLNNPALVISIRIKSLSRYAAGDYSSGLSFTVLPN